MHMPQNADLLHDVDALKRYADERADHAKRALEHGNVEGHDWFRQLEADALRSAVRILITLRERMTAT